MNFMNAQILNKKLSIIAGPCSVDLDNISDIMEIAEIKVSNRFGRKQRAVFWYPSSWPKIPNFFK